MKKNSRLILSTLGIIGIASIFGAIAYIAISNPELITTQSDSEESTEDDGETNDAVGSTISGSEISTGDNETSDDAESSTEEK